MKTYTVELIKRVTIDDILAETASDAVEQAKNLAKSATGTEFEIQEVFDQENEEVVMICEICGKDILSTDKYFSDTENGGEFHSDCCKSLTP